MQRDGPGLRRQRMYPRPEKAEYRRWHAGLPDDMPTPCQSTRRVAGAEVITVAPRLCAISAVLSVEASSTTRISAGRTADAAIDCRRRGRLSSSLRAGMTMERLIACVRLSGRACGNAPDEQEAGGKSDSAEEGWHDHGFPLAACSIIIRATCWPPSVTMGMPAPGLTLPPTKNRLWN